MNAERFTQKSVDCINTASSMAKEAGNQAITPEHLLYALLDTDGGLIRSLFTKMGVNCDAVLSELDTLISKLPKVTGGELYPSREASNVLQLAEKAAKQLGDEYISVEHIMLGIFTEGGKDIKRLLADHNITKNGFTAALAEVKKAHIFIKSKGKMRIFGFVGNNSKCILSANGFFTVF